MKVDKKDLEQFLNDNFDCYAEVKRDGKRQYMVLPALTVKKATELFIEYIQKLKTK